MLFLISPAKLLDYETPTTIKTHTLPIFNKQAVELAEIMKEKTPAEVATLMKLSDNLAILNVARFQEWSATATLKNSKQAVLTFNGEVYTGLDARSLNQAELDWAQEHLVMLSGLYGILRPYDLLQAYRLEMGTRLENPKGKNLYEYWKELIAPELNKRLKQDKSPVIINLASQEYMKSIDRDTLKARVVECVFEDFHPKSDRYRVIVVYAKRARGLMVRYAIKNRINTPQGLQSFDMEGYAYNAAASEPDRMVFRRRVAS